MPALARRVQRVRHRGCAVAQSVDGGSSLEEDAHARCVAPGSGAMHRAHPARPLEVHIRARLDQQGDTLGEALVDDHVQRGEIACVSASTSRSGSVMSSLRQSMAPCRAASAPGCIPIPPRGVHVRAVYERQLESDLSVAGVARNVHGVGAYGVGSVLDPDDARALRQYQRHRPRIAAPASAREQRVALLRRGELLLKGGRRVGWIGPR